MVFKLPIQGLTIPNREHPNGMRVLATVVVEIKIIVVMKIAITIQIVAVTETVAELGVEFVIVLLR
jgi:hypothetical protein